MATQHFRTGKLALQELPTPASRPGWLLAATRASLISAGTEEMRSRSRRASGPPPPSSWRRFSPTPRARPCGSASRPAPHDAAASRAGRRGRRRTLAASGNRSGSRRRARSWDDSVRRSEARRDGPADHAREVRQPCGTDAGLTDETKRAWLKESSPSLPLGLGDMDVQ